MSRQTENQFSKGKTGHSSHRSIIQSVSSGTRVTFCMK